VTSARIPSTALGKLHQRARALASRSIVKFGTVGLMGMVIDVGIFNALRLSTAVLPPAFTTPLRAAVISVTCAIVFNWLGNRYWTFRARRRTNVLAEFVEYLAVSLLGMLVSLACLWFSHYELHQYGLLADNIAKNGVGLLLGTAVRFVLVRYWVWGKHRRTGTRAVVPAATPASIAPPA
jgi:putative flippase GtrA